MLIQVYFNEVINYILKFEDQFIIKRLLLLFKKTIEYANTYSKPVKNSQETNVDEAEPSTPTTDPNKKANNFQKCSKLLYVYHKLPSELDKNDFFKIISPIKLFKELFAHLKDSFANRKSTLDLLVNDYGFLETLLECMNYFQRESEYSRSIKRKLESLNLISKDIYEKEFDSNEQATNDNIQIIKEELFNFSIEALSHLMNGCHITIKQKISKILFSEGGIMNEKATLNLFLRIILFEKDFGLKYEIGELIKFLIDESNNNVNVPVNSKVKKVEIKRDIYTFFLDNYANDFSNIIVTDFSKELGSSENYMNDSKQIIVDILGYAMILNNNKFSEINEKHGIINKLTLIESINNKYLNLYISKFFKILIFNSNEKMYDFLTTDSKYFSLLFNLLKSSLQPNVNKFKKEINNNNCQLVKFSILGSSILEIFECLKNNNQVGAKYAQHILNNHMLDISNLGFNNNIIETLEEIIKKSNEAQKETAINCESIIESSNYFCGINFNKETENSINNKYFEISTEKFFKDRDDDNLLSLNEENDDLRIEKKITNNSVKKSLDNNNNRLFSFSNFSKFKSNLFLGNKRSTENNFNYKFGQNNINKGVSIVHSYDDDNLMSDDDDNDEEKTKNYLDSDEEDDDLLKYLNHN